MTLLLVHTSCATADEADRIATAVVSEHLAACANRGAPIQSTYIWLGRLEKNEEIPLLMKTLPEKYEALQARIKQLHSYTTPLVLAWKTSDVDPAYMDWARAAVTSNE